MQNWGSGRGSKLILLFFIVVFVYLAFFQFDIQKAWDYTVSMDSSFFSALGF